MLVTMHEAVLQVCEAVRAAGGRAMLVGGWVRDRLLGHESKDYDLEVYAVEPEALRAILKKFGRVNTVGEHFAVYKLVCHAPNDERLEMDVSIPRRESKSGRGHRGFTIEGDPQMSFAEAARRRDFTINAILYDPLADEFIDPYGGLADLRQKQLRAVAAETFVEDSLRVLRAVQFAARFEMTVERDTVALCRTIDLTDLPHERIWGEVEKLLLMAAHPAIGLDVALALGVLDKLFPELRALVGSHLEEQPFEDDFTHTKRAFDHAAQLTADLDRPRRVTVMLATLCHVRGEPAARAVMQRLGLYTLTGYDVRAQVLALLGEQARPAAFYARREQTSDGDVRRLARRVEIDLLYRLVKACALAADSAGQAADWFIERARRLGVEHGPPAPLLQGRHLIEMGVAPGPAMGQQLRQIYELQLDGQVTTLDEARAAARRLPAADAG
ncbi:MAG TPA: polynucleotide adenylyltransferase [Blastocatellia bacterium]|nr:polynucleotide adenylyltransferase [Blastocatellia bacterium]